MGIFNVFMNIKSFVSLRLETKQKWIIFCRGRPNMNIDLNNAKDRVPGSREINRIHIYYILLFLSNTYFTRFKQTFLFDPY